MILLGAFAILLAGISLGLIGGGGSIMTVPILVYLFQIDVVTATGYSLLIVGLTAAIGTASYAQQNLVKFKTGLIFGIPSLLGVYTSRTFILPFVPDPVLSFGTTIITKSALLMTAFSLLMIVASLSMLKKGQLSKNQENVSPPSHSLQIFLVVGILGMSVGILTGFLGAGGGFLIVPALAIFLKYPMKSAIGTSLFIIAINSLVGFSADLFLKRPMDWTLLISLIFISSVGIFLGFRIAKKITGSQLKKVFGWFVFLMGTLIFIDQIIKF